MAEVFIMPPELERYRDLIYNTGGNTVEDLINRLRKHDNLIVTNFPVWSLAVAVESQIILLQRLHAGGLLKISKAGPAEPGNAKENTK